MSVITKIETQRNKSRVNIFVDDSFFCGLNKETAVIFGLKEGTYVDEDKLKQAITESEVKSAFEKSLDFLSRRMNSKKELSDKLTKKGYSAEVVQKALEKLEDYHYVDDKLFTKQFVESCSKLSKKIVKQKLAQRGVSPDIVLEIIGDRTDESEFELCLAQAKKYLKSRTISSFNDYQKMQASLFRKGFDYDMVKRVCRQLVDKSGFEEF